MNKQDIIQAILRQGALPLFYHDDFETCLQVTQTLYNAGIRVVEFTNRGENALKNCAQLLEAINQTMPGLILGIGTIKNKTEAKDFFDVGVHFFVSPVYTHELAAFANHHNRLWIPGCMTPTEIYTAQNGGATLIKLFPANMLQPGFVSAVKELFPGLLFMPTGGVKLETENIRSWFQSGVCAVGLGSQLITKDIMAQENYGKLLQDTKTLLQIIESVR